MMNKNILLFLSISISWFILSSFFVGCSNNSTKAFLHERDRPEGSYQILKAAKPFYNPELKKKKIEGWVIVRFSLNETGKVDSAEIYKEDPVGVFSDSAIRSVRESIYKPTVREGIPQRTDNLRTKINFKMAPSKKAHNNMDCNLSKPEDSANDLCSQIE